MKTHYKVIVVGGGTGGLMLSTQLMSKGVVNDIAVIEPSDKHYYQPAWTLVGAGTYDFKKTVKPMKDVMPKKVDWFKHRVELLIPDNNEVKLSDGSSLTYDFLVLSPGLEHDYTLVPGLQEAINDPNSNVVSIYRDPERVWDNIKNFKGGTALFTQPTTPIKCGGAPQKIMYLAAATFKKAGIKDKSKVVFATAGGVIFGVKVIKDTLMKVVDRKGINLKFGHQLESIDYKNKVAWYKLGDNVGYHNEQGVDIIQEDGRIGVKYDLLHTAPPSVAPKFITESGLSNAGGWLDVDQYTLQHKKHPNIFGIGDVAALPTAKTAAAIRKQVPVVIDHIKKMKAGITELEQKYNGYSSCPLVTEYGKMVLAEFDYDNNFTPDPKLKWMFVFDSSKESWLLWLLKKFGLPFLYWKKMLKGKDV